jgi:hypothetical protein
VSYITDRRVGGWGWVMGGGGRQRERGSERKEEGVGGEGGKGVCEEVAGERVRACRYHVTCKKKTRKSVQV